MSIEDEHHPTRRNVDGVMQHEPAFQRLEIGEDYGGDGTGDA
jgi:hypothetical protein